MATHYVTPASQESTAAAARVAAVAVVVWGASSFAGKHAAIGGMSRFWLVYGDSCRANSTDSTSNDLQDNLKLGDHQWQL